MDPQVDPKKVILVANPDLCDALGTDFLLRGLNPFPKGSIPISSQTFMSSLLPEFHHSTG